MTPRFHTLKVAQIERETADSVSLTFAIPPELAADYRYEPGQHLGLRVRLGDEEMRRSYSICSAPHDDELRIAIKKVAGGRFSAWAVDSLQPGFAIDVLTPEGRFHTPLDRANAKHYVAFAAGSGITPILSLANTARIISEQRDYSVRAEKLSNDELGLLTDAFNQMLTRIQEQTVALREREEQLRLALEASRTGTWDWSIKTNRVLWDEYNHTLFGLKPGAFNGSYDHFLSLVHPEDRTGAAYAVTYAVETKTEFNSEFRVIWPDGSVHYLASRGKALYDEAGQPARMTGVCLDISGRKQLEEILRQRAGQLAEAARRKDEFLAMLSHELRNPLAPLRTALYLLATDGPDHDRFLAMAERQVKQLVRLVDDLLDVSRITEGKITLRNEVVSLSELVSRAVETVRPLLDARGQVFTLSLPAESVLLKADPARLAQALGNLLSNASSYTPTAGSIWLTAERLDDEVMVRVRDTGAGLAPELLPHVFDLFVQGDTSLERAHGGLGIGLTIVRRVVEMHGGRVEAQSPGPGQGSEFILHLPVLPTTSAAEADRDVSPRVDDPVRALKVLVVEDNRDTAEGLARMLELWGHDVRLAFDGLAGLDLAERYGPDVILCDLGLPGMDGYELARRLRARAVGNMVLIAVSGYGRTEDRRRALDAGFDHHLVKPTDLGALAELLRRAAVTSAEARPQRLD